MQRNVRQGRFAVVAHGEQRAHGDGLVGGTQMHVEVEVGEGDGLAFGIGGDGRGGTVAGGLAAGPVVVVVWPFCRSSGSR